MIYTLVQIETLDMKKRKYSCDISKDIDIKSIKFETFTDSNGIRNRNWCHIGL